MKTIIKYDHESNTVEGAGEGHTNGKQQVVLRGLLSKSLKDLYLLWREYEFGLDGQKPARQFTSVEKGKVSSICSK